HNFERPCHAEKFNFRGKHARNALGQDRFGVGVGFRPRAGKVGILRSLQRSEPGCLLIAFPSIGLELGRKTILRAKAAQAFVSSSVCDEWRKSEKSIVCAQ
ncbi:MAG: hypothetical protein WB504_08640, partial [Pseudolabrys sp.]